MKKRILWPLLGAVIGISALVMVGCSGAAGGGYAGSGGSWTNYKCKAMVGKGGRVVTGWATTRSQAKANAMDKCQSLVSASANCHITGCYSEH